MNRKAKAGLATLGLISAVAFAVPAAAQDRPGFYAGGSLGQSDIDEEITTGLIDPGSGPVDGKDTAFKVFGGYMFNRHFGVEGAYVNLGEVSYSGDFFGLPVTGGKVEVSGFNAAALGSYPITEQFSVFGKIGLLIWEAEASDITGGVPFSAKEDGSDIFFGVGVGYNFTPNLGVRIEWERFKVEVLDDVDADLISVGIAWRF
jgi:OOP family OmpA-OmpF porin